ncbi:MAG: hypothetical protein ACK5KP_05205 [Paludibacteraceae bacterium]
MKRKLYFTILTTSLIYCLSGCNKKEIEIKNDKTNYELVFNNEVLLSQKVETFLDEYFNDTTLLDMHYFFLVVELNTDSLFLVINPMYVDAGFEDGLKDIVPVSIIKYKSKIIFLSTPLDVLFDKTNENSITKKIYDESLHKALIEYRDYHSFKRWMLLINRNDDSYNIIKSIDEFLKIYPSPKIEKDILE